MGIGTGRGHLFRWFFLAICLRSVSSAATCRAEEREALLDFIKPFQPTASEFCDLNWNASVDCCTWKGVECGKMSGHVHSLDLGCLIGPILGNTTISKLRFLRVLRLAGNFEKSSIPDSIGKLSKLRELDMANSALSGSIPLSLCDLKNLRSLRLFDNSLTGKLPSCLFDLPNVKEISLFSNRLEGSLPSKVNKLSQLVTLSLSENQIDGNVPSWLFTLPSLLGLGLSSNNLTGPIEPFTPPATPLLINVYLSNNRIRGPVPASLFQLVNVRILDLTGNLLSGVIEWNWLKDMRNLMHLWFSENRELSFKNSNGSTLHLPSLWGVNISYCAITEFPTALSAAASMSTLDVSHNKIAGRIFPQGSGGWKALANFYATNNLITGIDEYPERTTVLDLRFNQLQDPPLRLPNDIRTLLLSNNQLSGEIPIQFCNATNLMVLDLSFNNLSGVLHPCMMNINFFAMNLQGNHLHGTIPELVQQSIQYLVLSDNKFEGALPRTLKGCVRLEVLDVGNNNITDTFPGWLEGLEVFQILILRSNNFYGEIGMPTMENPFRSLQILDLSFNSFAGSIPAGFISNLGFMKNLTTMYIGPYIGAHIENPYKALWNIKVILQYSKFNKEFILPSFTIIDLSSNRFSGSIPATFGELNGLKVLNLSNNILSEAIPSSLADIGELELLDLSRNMLAGRIPQGLMELSFLEYLNVSYNKLEGPIPTGKRSELFSSSSYIGNPGLCGLPLSTVC